MSKHTKGPWRFSKNLSWSENDRGWNVFQLGGGHIATVSPRIADDSGNASEEGLANAHLIAAAPELLDALAGLVSCMSTPDSRLNPFKQFGIALAAIAKARGEA